MLSILSIYFCPNGIYAALYGGCFYVSQTMKRFLKRGWILHEPSHLLSDSRLFHSKNCSIAGEEEMGERERERAKRGWSQRG